MIESVGTVINAIVATLAAEYGERVRTVEAYDPLPDADDQARRAILAPAILLSLEQIDNDDADNDGTDRIPTRLFLVADCILPASIDQPAAQVREFAAAVAADVYRNRWGLAGDVGWPEALSVQPAEIKPGDGGYVAWRVIWEQLAMMGANYWAGGITPTEVYLGVAPRTGRAHIEDYWRV